MPVIKQNQTLFDMTVQYTGTLPNLFALAVDNYVGITDALTPGSSIKEPAVTDRRVVRVFAAFEYDVTTVLRPILTRGGIGYMGIGLNFKVS
jgi:hypothetical protein